MASFITEFPVQLGFDRAAFVAQLIAWLRGAEYSSVLDAQGNVELDKEACYFTSGSGEELRVREFERGGRLQAIGFRHDYPDDEGRLWRTETVLRLNVDQDGQNLIRLRTQCVAREPGARIETPRKPYILKTLLREKCGGVDGTFKVLDLPVWLEDNESSLDIAKEVIKGEAQNYLPVIYISSAGRGQWLFSRNEIEDLAFKLGGIAHVVVEPNEDFSFRLRDLVEYRNPYGGTVGVSLPGQGIVRRFYIGWQIRDVSALFSALSATALSLRGQMPAKGWDWTELQEYALQRQRERDRRRLSQEENEALYLEEISVLKDRNSQLEDQLASRSVVYKEADGYDGFISSGLSEKIGAEIYPGEFSDRIRFACRLVCDNSEKIGLDSRSRAVLSEVFKSIPQSSALPVLIENLKRASKDPKRLASDMANILRRHGYQEKSEKNHIRLEPASGYIGLGSITLAKTPSDSAHGLENSRKQIERTLGLPGLL